MRKIQAAWTGSDGSIVILFDSGTRGNCGCGRGEVISFNETSVTYKQNGSIRQYRITSAGEVFKHLGKE